MKRIREIFGVVLLNIALFIMGLAIIFNWGCNPPFNFGLTFVIIMAVIGIDIMTLAPDQKEE